MSARAAAAVLNARRVETPNGAAGSAKTRRFPIVKHDPFRPTRRAAVKGRGGYAGLAPGSGEAHSPTPALMKAGMRRRKRDKSEMATPA
jgi:hypothetical protein